MIENTLKTHIFTEEDKKLIAVLKSLPENYWDFKDDDVREYTHGIHNYPAMMVCPISRNIIRIVKDIRPVTPFWIRLSAPVRCWWKGCLPG